MTQPAVAEATGAALEGTEAAQPLTIPDSVRSSMAPHILATLPESQDEPPSDVDGEDSIDAELADATSDADGDETDTPSPDDQLASWIDLVDENPASITSVPRARQAEVIGTWKTRLEDAAVAAVQNAYQQGMDHGRQQTALTSQAATLAELLKSGDVESFNEMVKRFPGGEKNFFRVQADMTPLPVNSPEHFEQRAAQIVARLDAFPDAKAQLLHNWNYRAQESDLERLAFDVGQLAAQARPKRDPADQALQKRQQALEGRKRTPKPDVSEGAGASAGRLTFEALSKMTSEEILNLPKDEVARVVAVGPAR